MEIHFLLVNFFRIYVLGKKQLFAHNSCDSELHRFSSTLYQSLEHLTFSYLLSAGIWKKNEGFARTRDKFKKVGTYKVGRF